MSYKQRVVCLSGWAQNCESIAPVFNELNQNLEIINFDYSKYNQIDDLFFALKNLNKNLEISPDILCGWSLGGQLAIRLIAAKIFNPKLLILIAPPFQFVKSPTISAAMPESAFFEFRNNFAKSPDKTLKRFSILSLMNDKNAAQLISNLQITDENHHNLIFWLDELKRFSCHEIDFSNFPPTLLIQGAGDMVVHPNQAHLFKEKISDLKLEILSNTGHAPHLGNLEKVKEIIREFIDA